MLKRKKRQISGSQAIAVVDLYAEGKVYRAGIDKISVDSPIYKNTSWAFTVVEDEVTDGQ